MEIRRTVTGLVVIAAVAAAVAIGATVVTPQTDPDVGPEASWYDMSPEDTP